MCTYIYTYIYTNTINRYIFFQAAFEAVDSNGNIYMGSKGSVMVFVYHVNADGARYVVLDVKSSHGITINNNHTVTWYVLVIEILFMILILN